MDLFETANQSDAGYVPPQPLAERMRPRSLREFAGDPLSPADAAFIRKMIANDNIFSMILYGPPGTGKTTLANIIANETKAVFVRLNAVSSGVADIRKTVEQARERLKFYRQRTIVFIDEVHRFNKSQQDALLPYVENGTILLIGATTENPYFEVNSALISRTKIIRLDLITPEAVVEVLKRALADSENGLGALSIRAEDKALEILAKLAGGDARRALNFLEQAAFLLDNREDRKLTVELIGELVGEKALLYDKKGDNHYDVISAFIKSMRGSDPDAAMHYLARMLASGEDVKFIARRILICAAEDVGNADPQAIVVAMAAAQAVQFVGMPEARIPLAQATAYVASAPKSNAAYLAIDAALADVKDKDCGYVPSHLRDAHYQGAVNFGHGIEYLYPHDYPNAWITQEYMPEPLRGRQYYRPSDRGYEAKIREYRQGRSQV